MANKVRDLVDLSSRDDAASQSDVALLSAILSGPEMGDVFTRVVARLASDDRGDLRSCLIVGSPGCGKSLILDTLARLFEPGRTGQLPSQASELRALARGNEASVVRVPHSGERESLPVAVLAALRERLPRAPEPDPSQCAEWHVDRVAEVASTLTSGRLLLVLDDLDLWFRTSMPEAAKSLQAAMRLGKLTQQAPIAVVAALGEHALAHEAIAADAERWIAPLLSAYRIEYVPSDALRDAAAAQLLPKAPRQRLLVRQVLEDLRRRLPDLTVSDEEFEQLYPLEPATWRVASHLHRFDERFSLRDFVTRAVETVKNRPATGLFTLADLFSIYGSQLRRAEGLEPLFSAYDRLNSEAVSKLDSSERFWARTALQAVLLFSVAGQSVTAREVAHGLLLYPLEGADPDYARITEVLARLERLGGGILFASGDGEGRRYAVLGGTGESVRTALVGIVDDMASTYEDGCQELEWAVLGLGGACFADWPVAVGASEGPEDWEVVWSTKSVVAWPHASSGAVARLAIMLPGTPWSAAVEEASATPGTVCWIAPVPGPSERERVKRWHAAAGAAERGWWSHLVEFAALKEELRVDAARVFQHLYVERGTFVTATGSRPAAECVDGPGNASLAALLAALAGGAPVRAVASAPAAATAVAVARAPAPPVIEVSDPSPVIYTLENDDADWVASLISASVPGDEAQQVEMLRRWYEARVGHAMPIPARLLAAASGDGGAISSGIEARHRLDLTLFYVQKALAVGTISGLGAVLGQIFGESKALAKAVERSAWLEDFSRWVVDLDRAESFLREVGTCGEAELDQLNGMLLAWVSDAGRFVEESKREAFADAFHGYLQEYRRHYADEHRRSVSGEMLDRVVALVTESRPFRTLEALTSMPMGDTRFILEARHELDALRAARCDREVEKELEEQTRCRCGFKLADRWRAAATAARAIERVERGIEWHLAALDTLPNEVRLKVKDEARAFDVAALQEIADLVGSRVDAAAAARGPIRTAA